MDESATTQVATRASLRRRDVATGGATPAPPAPQPRRKKKRRAVSPDRYRTGESTVFWNLALTYCLLSFFARAGASRKRRMRRRPMRAAHVVYRYYRTVPLFEQKQFVFGVFLQGCITGTTAMVSIDHTNFSEWPPLARTT